jgi:16S rRNA (uracil1498-N3)-methyltransferase
MPRCLADSHDLAKAEFTLDADVSHHVLNVLRLRAGARVTVFDGRGGECLAEISATAGRRATVRVLNRHTQARPRAALTLIQALPKGPRMDLIVQKAVELGAAAIMPVRTRRVVVQLDEARAAERRERWQKIAAAAAEQCGANWTPEIEPVADFETMLPRLATFDLAVFGSLDAGAKPLRAALAGARERPLQRVALLIGPEGDLTPEETDAVRGAGGVPVSFGALTLRVETAAIYGLSVLAYELL